MARSPPSAPLRATFNSAPFLPLSPWAWLMQQASMCSAQHTRSKAAHARKQHAALSPTIRLHPTTTELGAPPWRRPSLTHRLEHRLTRLVFRHAEHRWLPAPTHRQPPPPPPPRAAASPSPSSAAGSSRAAKRTTGRPMVTTRLLARGAGLSRSLCGEVVLA